MQLLPAAVFTELVSNSIMMVKQCIFQVLKTQKTCFKKGTGYFAVDGNLPSETILP